MIAPPREGVVIPTVSPLIIPLLYGRVGSAYRGMVRRWGRFFSRVRHRGVPDREKVSERCHASRATVAVCSDAPARAQRAERAADGGVVDVSRALSVSSSAP